MHMQCIYIICIHELIFTRVFFETCMLNELLISGYAPGKDPGDLQNENVSENASFNTQQEERKGH